MLPKSVICPRCDKPGFLTLRWVRSSHYCKIEIPNYKTQWVMKKILKPLMNTGRERTITVKRNFRRYAPIWHLYIGHYDAEKYKKAMVKYKLGKLKSRPNGRRWCKVCYKAVKGEAHSDLDILMARYSFTLWNLKKEEKDRKEDFRLKRGIY